MDDVLSEVADVTTVSHPPLNCSGPVPADSVFFGAKRGEAAFGGDQGYAQGASFTAQETARIRDIVHAHLIANARNISADLADKIANTPLDEYHTIPQDGTHARLLSKLGRILPAGSVAEIRSMSFFDYAQQAFGPFELSDEEGIGHEQVCFRVVRPHNRNDVGTLHTDTWFWEYYNFPVPPGKARVKAWVPVCGSPSQAGLILAPGSHRGKSGFTTETTNGKLGFVPQADVASLTFGRFCGAPGDTIMFNHDLLHVGSVNRGSQCRVSFEITILFDSEQ